MEALAVALGIGFAALLFFFTLDVLVSKKKESPISQYAKTGQGGEQLSERFKKGGAYSALVTGHKDGSLSVSVRNKAGAELDSYQTSDPNEQLNLLDLRRDLAEVGIHAKRVRDSNFLERKVQNKLRYS